MKLVLSRIMAALVSALIVASLASPLLAQAPGATPTVALPLKGSAEAQSPSAPIAPAAPRTVQSSPTSERGQGASADDGGRSVSSTGRVPRDLSPWSMFLAADVVVKGVMISLALASLVTWTIFFAKTVHLSRAQARLREALARVAETRTLSEAQLTLSSHDTVLSSLLRGCASGSKIVGR